LPNVLKESDQSLGEGIQNLRERLDYIYNSDYLLEDGKTSEENYSVIISIPISNG
jgi:sensor histidine kinase YesM